MKSSVLFLFLLCLTGSAAAQELVIDPATSAAILSSSAVMQRQLNTTNNDLSMIQKAQLAVGGQLVLANDLQQKIYEGLAQVASVITDLASVHEIASCGADIVRDVELAVNLARSNPVLLLFAEQGARDFQLRSIMLSAEVGNFVVAGGPRNLMNAGQRARLLQHIESEMQVLRGIAYGMGRAMYWARMNGIWNSLNPWVTWQNTDVRIAHQVLSAAKFNKP